MLMGLRPSAMIIAIGAFGAHFCLPIFNGCNQAIWQSTVPPDVQGRVFATRQMIARIATPIAYLSAGPLADSVFGPLLVDGGALAGSLGQIVGVGAGRGIGLLFMLMGILAVLVSVIGYASPRIRAVGGDADATEYLPAAVKHS